MERSTQLTISCPECGTTGFRFLRTADDAIVDLKTGIVDRLQRHVPMSYAMSGFKMVCPKCGYVHDKR